MSPGKQTVLFNASAYQDADVRLNLCLRPEAELLSAVQGIDEQVLEQLRPRLSELFGDSSDCYLSPLKQYKGTWCLRTKITVVGKTALRCWDVARKRCPYQEDWTSVAVTPRLWVKHMYVTPNSCGLVLECTDVLVEPIVPTCPV